MIADVPKWINDSLDLLTMWIPYPFSNLLIGAFAIFCAGTFVTIAIKFFAFLRRL